MGTPMVSILKKDTGHRPLFAGPVENRPKKYKSLVNAPKVYLQIASPGQHSRVIESEDPDRCEHEKTVSQRSRAPEVDSTTVTLSSLLLNKAPNELLIVWVLTSWCGQTLLD